MAKYIHYRCDSCGGTFKYLHATSDDLGPTHCGLCGAVVIDGDDPFQETFVPQAPVIRKSTYAKSVDQTYRAMEAASIQRAEEAADMLGVPKAEMSDIKITNMRDPSEMREGDTAAIMPSMNPHSPTMTGAHFATMDGGVPDHAPGVGGGMQSVMARHRQLIGGSHAERAAQFTARGNIGKYSGR